MFAGYAVNKTEEFLFILGGEQVLFDGSLQELNIITIYDIQQDRFMECTLECPFKGDMHAICMGDDKRDELLVFGFVNDLYQAKEFKNLRKLPVCLINLILKRVNNEYLHILQLSYHDDDNQHYKINIDDILNSTI